MERSILIAGGANDPNLQHLLKTTRTLGLPVIPFLVKENESPSFFWDLHSNRLLLNEEEVDIQSAFIRRNVFHSEGTEGHDRSLAWYSALAGWLSVNQDVTILNRAFLSKYTNKLQVLDLAVKVGFNIPHTRTTNAIGALKHEKADWIAKPVMGGGYCHPLEAILPDSEIRLGVTANPAIVQQQIFGDDIRIYAVGKQYFGFQIHSKEVDYRRTPTPNIKLLDLIPKHIQKYLSEIMKRMGLNWGAADFKRCEQTGKLYFLEINSNPMFSVFDKKAGGRISQTILTSLLNPLPS